MVSSTMLTLVVIPVIYAVFKDLAIGNTPFSRGVTRPARTCVMMPDTMGMMGGMGWTMGVVWLLVLVFLVLAIAALAKYLFSKPRN